MSLPHTQEDVRSLLLQQANILCYSKDDMPSNEMVMSYLTVIGSGSALLPDCEIQHSGRADIYSNLNEKWPHKSSDI